MAYLRTRLCTWRMFRLWLLVVAVAAISAFPASVDACIRLGSMALLLITQLRLWDDMADLPHDRVNHPDRVLVHAASLRSFQTVLAGMMIATVVALLLQGDAWRLMTYAGLVSLLAFLYHGGLGAALGRGVQVALVLVKYPAIALLSAVGPPTPFGWSAATVLFALLCAHEYVDHRRGALR